MEDAHKLQTGSILLVAPRGVPSYMGYLRRAFDVAVALTVNEAVKMLPEVRPTLAMIDPALETDATTLCGAAKELPHPPPVLITMSRPDLAAAVLIAGCTAILVPPFEPSELLECVGRLRAREDSPTLDAAKPSRNSAVGAFGESSTRIMRANTAVWPDADCPYCGEGNCVSFDAVGLERMWYACLQCRQVWIAPPRQS